MSSLKINEEDIDQEITINITFPSVKVTSTDVNHSILGPSEYIHSASESKTTTYEINKKIKRVEYNGKIILDGAADTIIESVTSELNSNNISTYSLRLSNGIIYATTTGSSSITNSSGSSPQKMLITALSKEISIVGSSYGEIIYNGNSVGVLKYNDNIVWIKKFFPTVTSNKTDTYYSDVFIERISNKYDSTLEKGVWYSAAQFLVNAGDSLTIKIEPNSSTAVYSVTVNSVEKLDVGYCVSPGNTYEFSADIESNLEIKIVNLYKSGLYSYSTKIEWDNTNTVMDAATASARIKMQQLSATTSSIPLPVAYKIVGTTKSTELSDASTISVISKVGRESVINSGYTNINRVYSNYSVYSTSTSNRSGITVYVDATGSVNSRNIIYSGTVVTLNITGVEWWKKVI